MTPSIRLSNSEPASLARHLAAGAALLLILFLLPGISAAETSELDTSDSDAAAEDSHKGAPSRENASAESTSAESTPDESVPDESVPKTRDSRTAPSETRPLELIRVSADGPFFEGAVSGNRFVVWGVNYDHDRSGRLLDEYWIDEWQAVVEDFHEIKALGANCVRIHLQLGHFMDGPETPSRTALDQLARLIRLAEDTRLYLDITGLACYHKASVPAWYDSLEEQQRWAVQAAFWEAVAQTCGNSPAVFCYDLMNEPILPGRKPATDWLAGEFGGKHFVQRLALALNGRSRQDIAQAWVNRMADAIRKHDRRHMITVGVIPWVLTFGGGRPLFYSPRVGQRLDFVAVHFYPRKGQVDKAIRALQAYEVGKPLLVEETFPLRCTAEELTEFIDRSASHVDGWISFYWGRTASELRADRQQTIGDAITASWLDTFRETAASVQQAGTRQTP